MGSTVIVDAKHMDYSAAGDVYGIGIKPEFLDAIADAADPISAGVGHLWGPEEDDFAQLEPESVGVCPNCGKTMNQSAISGSLYVCSACGFMQNMGEDISSITTSSEDMASNMPFRLKIVGVDSRCLQYVLNKASVTNYSETQRQNIQDEFLALNWESREDGFNMIPQNVLMLAADIYHQVQKAGYVCRSESKRSIMASCLYRASTKLGFYRDKKEITRFIKLHKSSARGENFLAKLSDDGKIDIDVNQDICDPLIDTLFLKMGVDAVTYDVECLKAATREIVDIANDLGIGSSSTLKSKVAGAACVILSKADATSSAATIQQKIIDVFEIRKMTISRFTSELAKYHSKFVHVYEKYGLAIDADRHKKNTKSLHTDKPDDAHHTKHHGKHKRHGKKDETKDEAM